MAESSDTITVSHASGTTATIHLYGATVTSLKLPSGKEVLFTSSKAVFDESKPIRGGIPLVFPQFGPGELPNHGFARTSKWTVISNEGGVAVLDLKDSDATRSIWDHRFTLVYTVTVTDKGIQTALTVNNRDESAFKFQALLHTYFNIPKIEELTVKGLEGLTYIDKMRDQKEYSEDRKEITISEETDRIYRTAPNTVELYSKDDKIAEVRAFYESSAEEKRAATDVVLWNPWVEKSIAMSDFGDEEYHNMVSGQWLWQHDLMHDEAVFIP